jgi:hypothetical protein
MERMLTGLGLRSSPTRVAFCIGNGPRIVGRSRDGPGRGNLNLLPKAVVDSWDGEGGIDRWS